tara:strand:- start:2479 stop:2730 length:252 start_codon:yes stop_codon:yes gene_type:complete
MAYTKLMAFKEALSDTGIAAVVNIPLNFVLVYLCIDVWQVGTMWTSVIMTSIFTLFAITRKTYIRLYFNAEFLKKQENEQQNI